MLVAWDDGLDYGGGPRAGYDQVLLLAGCRWGHRRHCSRRRRLLCWVSDSAEATKLENFRMQELELGGVEPPVALEEVE